MRLSVVVVNWNSRDDLATCLRSLEEQDHDLEVVVVDNGSSDGSVAMVHRDFPGAMLVEHADNRGFAAGCNAGIDRSTADWVCLLNNDATAQPGWAAALAKAAAAASSDCGMLQSLMLYRDRPDTVNSTGVEVVRSGWGRDRDEGRPRASCLRPAEIFCPTGGAAAYKRTMLEAVRLPSGYLDSDYFLYYEDVDLGWRCRLAGWRAEYVPESTVTHVSQGSARRYPARWLERLAHVNRMRTLIKNGSAALLVRTAPKTVARFLPRLTANASDAPSRARQPVADALRSALRARRIVASLARVSRRSLEARWLVA